MYLKLKWLNFYIETLMRELKSNMLFSKVKKCCCILLSPFFVVYELKWISMCHTKHKLKPPTNVKSHKLKFIYSYS